MAFEAVQMAHCQAFASGRRDQLMAQRAEREKALARLQMALEAAQDEPRLSQDSDYANRLRAKFSTLIENEAALAEHVLQVRAQLLDDLAAMRQGKRVLQGYGQHPGSSPPPRFLNSKT